EQRITVLADQSTTLFAADAPRMVSRDVQTSSRQAPWDLVQGQFPAPLKRGESYRVLSSIPRATPDELRLALRSSAPWLAPYLALPAALPARVRTLAAETAGGASNDYDRAAALESYLRDLTYSTHLPTPPPGRDWVDYLLFDSRVGYCDYFATALAVMARSLGLPARVASGFAPGILDQTENTYLVRESEAHSWTEIYFTGYGWITFEPSAIRARPERGAALSPTPASEPAPSSAPSAVEEQAQPSDEVLDLSGAERFEAGSMTATGAVLLIAACLLVVSGLAVGAASYVWRRRLDGLQPRQRDYGELLTIAALARVPVEPSMTPSEIANQIAERFPSDADAIQAVSRAYVEAIYSLSSGELAPGHGDWERRRPRLMREALRRRLARRDHP
ncbi:MAG: transglutaminase domain-containing protein, partial [Chloroflexi bacterium]|nr:transglutaminase domain-containing protein [Chloroflexota bacterium]